MLPLHSNIKLAYAAGVDQEQNFIQNLAMFLCTYLKEHGNLLEKKDHNEVLLKVCINLRNVLFIFSVSSMLQSVVFSGFSVFGIDIGSWRSRDIQNLSRILERVECWFIQRESVSTAQYSFFGFQIGTSISNQEGILPSCTFSSTPLFILIVGIYIDVSNNSHFFFHSIRLDW